MLKLNLARNCLKYIIRAYGIKEIFIPYYSCETIWQAIRQENCKIHFYHIDKNMLPVCDFPPNSFVLYINYFGLCRKNCINLAAKYPNLIVDNTHDFHCEPIGLASFNSLRKFFKAQNGAYLFCEKILDETFEEDDLSLPSVYMNEDYDLFVKNELRLNKETQIKTISPLVASQMKNIDFAGDKNIRRILYKKYSKVLGKHNLLRLDFESNFAPYCYPFMCEDEEFLNILSKGGFTLLRLWDKNTESNFQNVIAFPLYDYSYAQGIIDYVKQYF